MSSPATSHSSAMPRHPAEILLDKNCRIGSCQNSTSAKADNSEGLSVEVFFEIRDPPALSLCFARCHDLSGVQRLPARGGPDILSAAGAFVLLAVPFSDDSVHNQMYVDYFVYRAGAGPGGVPSLHLLPRPNPDHINRRNVAVMPIGDGGSQHYAVVFPDMSCRIRLLDTHNHYALLQIYRSDTKAWRTQPASIADDTETQDATTMKLWVYCATSVAYAGSGLLGWVDPWLGVLLCNVLDENPILRFVPLPVPGPCEAYNEFFKFEDLNPGHYRQVTMHNGVMKFTEMQFHQGPAFNVKRRDDKGWMATTWTRPVVSSSSDAWHEGLTFDTSDLSVSVAADGSSFLHLLPEILAEEEDQKELELDWDKFHSGAPTLSLHPSRQEGLAPSSNYVCT